SQVLLRFFSGSPQVLLRFFSGSSQVLLRFFLGSFQVLLRFSSGSFQVLLRFTFFLILKVTFIRFSLRAILSSFQKMKWVIAH
ncbi:hypothetical protein, partial [Aerococcus christensenii]|uniref:hypothetical protein n=1 Tax=Aerococcus christensenii TaxID=87541 RepID=UPI00254ED386